jgi:RND family efflux transporter MFP subunit
MKNVLVLLLAVLFLASCAGTKADETPEQQIRAYEKQIAEINEKIQQVSSDASSDDINVAALSSVKAEEVKTSFFKHSISVSGNVEAIKFAGLNPEMSGKIISILVAEGQVVNKGTVLAQLDDRLLQSQLKQAETSLELAATMYDRQKELWEQNIGTEIQYLQVKNQKESLENQIQLLKIQISMTKVLAPFDGLIDRIYLKEGELANPAVKFMDFVNLSQLYVNTEISEDYINRIKQGDEALIKFPAFPNIEIKSIVFRTTNIVNPNSRSFLTRFKIDNPGNKIKPNIIANVLLSDYQNENAISIPSILLQSDMDGKFVFIADKHENVYEVRKQYVETGLNEAGKIEILKGLYQGELLITEGYNQVRKGQKINVIE